MEKLCVRPASVRACNWCGPSALADSDPGPEALCTHHQAAYFERRAQDEALADGLWYTSLLEGLYADGLLVAAL